MAHNAQHHQRPPPRDQAPLGSSQPPMKPGSSSSSSMSQFYTPMNPSYIPQGPPAPSLSVPQQPSYPGYGPASASTTLPVPGPSIGANAALILANLTTTPGFLSETAIQEARREYAQRQAPTPATPSISSNPHKSVYASTHSSHPYRPQAHRQSQPTSTRVTASNANDPISTLLKELQQSTSTSSSTFSSSSTPSSTPSSRSIQASNLARPSSSNTPIKRSTSQRPLSSSSSSSSSSLPSPASRSTSAPTSEAPSSEPEDFSNGKITPKLIKKLATIAETDAEGGGTLLQEIKRLRQKQRDTERTLYEKRQALMQLQKKDLVKLQANEIMGMDISSDRKKIKAAHMQKLKEFDKGVILEMDKEIAAVQASLAKTGIPMMHVTQEPAMIVSQIKVLRLLEDMLQT